MTSKQKIMVSVIGIVMVLAIIGLTIGLVLTASQVTASTNMNVSFTSKEVAATIVGTDKYYEKGTGGGAAITTAEQKVVFTAGSETATGKMTFDKKELVYTTDTVVYAFAITNDGTGHSLDAYYTMTAGTNATVTVSTDGITFEAFNTTANTKFSDAGINAGDTLTLYVKVAIADATTNMTGNGSISITLVKTGETLA